MAPYEIVERKGIGHPDSLADGIAELASIRYSQYCLSTFGIVLHHNLDKVGVCGGMARFGWRTGQYVRPLRVVFAGRASTSFGDHQVPVRDILESAAREQLSLALPGVDHVALEFHHLTTDSSVFPRWFRPRSTEDLPELRGARSNDTAYVVATSHTTIAEQIALGVEGYFRGFTWAGSDIKVMVIRNGHSFSVTCCVPGLVGAFAGPDEYREQFTAAKQSLHEMLRAFVDGSVDLHVRALDGLLECAPPVESCYINVSGSAIDYGEDGLVGRGNDRHGLITPNHSRGNEALFGKNPAYHVGKVGAYMADRVAQSVGSISGPCRVGIMYRKGDSYACPMSVHLHLLQASDEQACRMAAREALLESGWIGALVEGERYRPRLSQHFGNQPHDAAETP